MQPDAQLLNIAWMLLCAALVMLMQGGFCFLESGFARAKNSINVAIKNLVDFCVASAVFWAFGFGLMFGASKYGLIGTSDFLMGKGAGPWLLAFFLFQLVFCGTATTIISGAVAERMRFRAYLLVSLLVSGLMYPVFGHWAWGGAATGEHTGWLASLGFIDFAGSTVVHSVGAWIALAATITIGPRRGRFGKDGSEIHGHNLTMATLGVLLLWFSWFGFNGGSTLGLSNDIPLILVNTNLGAAFGGLAGLATAWIIERRPVVSHVINGVVAGLVAITAACHIVSPAAACLIGAVGGLLCSLTTYLLPRLRIDDVIGAFPAHGVGGIWGTLSVALLADAGAWGTGLTRWQQLGVQSLGVLACFGWAFGLGFVAIRLMNRVFPLRVTIADEKVGLNVSEHGASTDLVELMSEMQSHRLYGNFSRKVFVDPHTEVGQIAREYNRVLDKVTTEIHNREEAEKQYRGIFENAVEGIFRTTPDGRYLAANPALARIYGYDSADALCAGVDDIGAQVYVDPNRRAEFMKRMSAEGIVTNFQSQVRRRDGSIIWISENARIHCDEQGNVRYYEGTVEDITQLKSNERLAREKEAAEAANRAKSQFLANMSHEIRTPLNGVVGMLDLLAGTELTSQQRRYVEVARSSADLLLNVINDILDFSKIEAGKLELEGIEFNLREVVETVPDIFVHQAYKKGLELCCRISGDVPHAVVGDPERLRQVLGNLVNNAIKFTARGEVSVRCDVDAAGPTDQTVWGKFSVTDTGIGIPEDRLSRLFQSFSQVDATTTRQYGGTGLGLAICKQLVELMGGQIGVESREGVGSNFWFRIPLQIAQRSLQSRPRPSTTLDGLRVLAVDDNNTNLQILGDSLRGWGIDATVTRSSAEALDLLADAARDGRPFDLLILDNLMPGLTGLQLAAEVRRNGSLGNPKIILLTSLDADGDAAEFKRLRLTCLQKPVRQSRLFNVIATLVADGQDRTPPSRDTESDASAATDDASALVPRHPILVVDDNEINRMVVAEILQAEGFVFDCVSNGREAVAAARSGRFRLILMDCEMPEMDGFEATHHIRRMEAAGELAVAGRDRIPIIALTAQAVQGDRQRCLDAGMTEYVSKPIDRERLLRIIRRCLQGSCPRSEIEPPHEMPVEPASPRPEMRTVDTEVLNVTALAERSSGSRDFIARILGKFETKAREQVRQLSEACKSGDDVQTSRLAHALRGVASNVGAMSVSRAATALEQAIRKQTPDDRRELHHRIEEELTRCIDAIHQLLDEPATDH